MHVSAYEGHEGASLNPKGCDPPTRCYPLRRPESTSHLQGGVEEVAVSVHRRSIIAPLVLMLSATCNFASTHAAAATKTYRPPANISHARTCSARLGNSSNRLNAWLAGLHTQRGDIIQLARNQCYRTDKTIVLSGKSHVTFDGNGSTFASFRDSGMERENAHFRIQDD